MRNYITRAVGSHPHVEPDIQSYRPLTGDLYLLTTDGLTRELTNPEIAAILNRCVPGTAEREVSGSLMATPDPFHSEDVAQKHLLRACHALIEAANARGGRDNITVLLLYFG
jgi:protein phosphatase